MVFNFVYTVIEEALLWRRSAISLQSLLGIAVTLTLCVWRLCLESVRLASYSFIYIRLFIR